jgi:16S rRNA (cytosine967-C5)-methyltransferase
MRVKQSAILAGAARLVKPGGRLVYATCSLLALEDEDVAAEFSAAHADFEPLPAAEALARAHVTNADALVSGHHLRLWPHRHGTDGFFAALWTRR